MTLALNNERNLDIVRLLPESRSLESKCLVATREIGYSIIPIHQCKENLECLHCKGYFKVLGKPCEILDILSKLSRPLLVLFLSLSRIPTQLATDAIDPILTPALC